MTAYMLSILDRLFSDASLVPLLLAIIAVVFLLSSVRRRLRHQASRDEEEPVQRKPPPGKSSQARLRNDLETLLGELQDLSRRISAEIDTRFAKLEAAMNDADRRIAALNRLSGQSSADEDETRSTDEADTEEAVPSVSPTAIEDTAESKPEVKQQSPPESPEPEGETRQQAVYRLADQGVTPVEIARQLGRTPGEVELILNLRQQWKASTGEKK